jgi:hypothetical protein
MWHLEGGREKRCLKSKLEEYATGRTVDELAPSLSSLVHALVTNNFSADYANPQLFIEMTQPTESMSAVLSQVLGAVKGTRGRFAAMFLDADMGSGKTHLLALLLHLFYSLKKWPQFRPRLGAALAQLLGENIDAVDKDVAVLAVDLKTGTASETLRLFAESLKTAGDRGAAELVEKANYDPRRINGEELARAINDKTSLLILVDELFGFAVMNCDRADHEMVHLLRLIYELVQRRRPLADSGESAVALLVASARSDYRSWRQVSSACRIGVFVDQFERDLQRVRLTAGARWVSVEEAVQIVAKRLGLSPRDFSRGLYDLAEKVLREDTPFPQAHHLRGLIKAMASYALSACEAGHGRITAAHLTEAAISALMGIDASRYKSLYDVIRRKAEGDLLYAVNAVFTGSMVGDPERLTAVVAGDKSVVSSTERWIMEELKEIMPTEAAAKALKALKNLPHIKAVESGGEAAYVATPFLNVRAFLTELYNEALKTESVDAPRRLKEFLLRSQTPTWANVVVADGDFDPKQLRDGALNLIVVLSGDPRQALEKARGFAAAVAPKHDALAPAFAKESAFMRAVSEAKAYLESRESERMKKAGEKIYERILESYRKELLDAAVEKASEVFNELTRAVADALSDAYYKTPTGAIELAKVKLAELNAKPEKVKYETLFENLEQERNKTVGNALSKYLEALAQAVGFIFNHNVATSLGHRFEFGNYIELSKTNRIAQVAGQYYVFSREAYESFLQAVRGEALKRGYAVYERGDLVVIEQKPQQLPPPRSATPEPQPTAQPLAAQLPAQPQRAYDFDAVLNAIAEGAEVEVSFVVADPGIAAAFLNAVKNNIKKLQVKSGGWTYNYTGG